MHEKIYKRNKVQQLFNTEIWKRNSGNVIVEIYVEI